MKLPEMLKPLLPLAVLVCVAAIFSACSSDDNKDNTASPTTAASKGPTIDVSGVPELKDGVLTIGSDIAYAPIEYYEEGTTNEKGMDVDIAKAMAQLMGVKVEFKQVADFAGIVGDLKASRYDMIMSAISVTPEREAEIDFVPYFGPVGTGILTKAANPLGFTKIEDLCGHPVAAQDGTFQIDQMTTLNDGPCAANKIDIRAFPDNPTAVQEIILGRVDAHLSDDPVAAYSAIQSQGNLVELAVTGFEAAPYGIGVRKDSTALKTALQQALQKIMDDATYTGILKTWGQEQFALKP